MHLLTQTATVFAIPAARFTAQAAGEDIMWMQTVTAYVTIKEPAIGAVLPPLSLLADKGMEAAVAVAGTADNKGKWYAERTRGKQANRTIF